MLYNKGYISPQNQETELKTVFCITTTEGMIRIKIMHDVMKYFFRKIKYIFLSNKSTWLMHYITSVLTSFL